MVSSNPKVAIVGLNVGINGHLPAFRTEGWDVVAMCATTKDKVESIAKENNVPGAYVNTNYDDMLKIPALDAVVVASPSMSHVDLPCARSRPASTSWSKSPLPPTRLNLRRCAPPPPSPTGRR